MSRQSTYLELCDRVTCARQIVDQKTAAVADAKALVAQMVDPPPLCRAHVAAWAARVDAVKRDIIDARKEADAAATAAAACNHHVEQFREWQDDLVRTPRRFTVRR